MLLIDKTITKNYDVNFISKDKIKDKIKELENNEEHYTFYNLNSKDIKRTCITILEEILKEN